MGWLFTRYNWYVYKNWPKSLPARPCIASCCLIPTCLQILIIHGTSDAVTSPTASQQFYNALPASDKKISLYEVRLFLLPLLVRWCPSRENIMNYIMRMMAYRSDYWRRSFRGSRLPRLQRIPNYNKCHGTGSTSHFDHSNYSSTQQLQV